MWKVCQETGKAHAQVLQNLKVTRWMQEADLPPFPRLDGKNESNMSEQRGDKLTLFASLLAH